MQGTDPIQNKPHLSPSQHCQRASYQICCGATQSAGGEQNDATGSCIQEQHKRRKRIATSWGDIVSSKRLARDSAVRILDGNSSLLCDSSTRAHNQTSPE